ncbi:MAG: transporter substrate-binding domain-containing protein, partial [Propionibacteriaceae bacterium]|nr:transporter substrate-binding domain-containing protein [Propionibacteriaceae bacterium]
GEIYANQNKPASATLVTFPSDGEMWPAIQAGSVDALLQDLPVNNEHAHADAAYVIVERYQTDEQYGFALEKGGNPDLLKAINDALQGLRDDGTYQETYDKYFS